MAVAKSYQNFEIIEGVFEVNGRKYVMVKTDKGVQKQVRWYTDAEYAKMYGLPAVASDKRGVDGMDHSNDKFFRTQKEVLGFKNGYITIFKGNTYEVKDWFKEHGATYRKWWGWSFASDIEMPETFPEGVEPLKLTWEAVGADMANLKPEDQVKAIVEALIYDAGDTEFVGNVGDKIEVVVTVEKNATVVNYYGENHLMTLVDEDGHYYVWSTAAKNWEEGTEHHIKGTIKDHKTYKGVNQTWLTRCREVE